MVREGLAKSGEMVVVERLMDLKMGEVCQRSILLIFADDLTIRMM